MSSKLQTQSTQNLKKQLPVSRKTSWVRGPALPNIDSRWRTAATLDFPQNAIIQQLVELHLQKSVGVSQLQPENGHMTKIDTGSKIKISAAAILHLTQS